MEMSKTNTDVVERTKQTWPERVNMLSVNPDAANRHDIAQMAAEIQSLITLLGDIEEMRVDCVMSLDESSRTKKCDLLHGWCELSRMKFRERKCL